MSRQDGAILFQKPDLVYHGTHPRFACHGGARSKTSAGSRQAPENLRDVELTRRTLLQGDEDGFLRGCRAQ